MTVSLFVLLPFALAILFLLLPDRAVLQRRISLFSGLGLLGLALWLLSRTLQGEVFVVHLGGWGARFGIVWMSDGLSALMLMLAALLSLATLWYAPPALEAGERPHFYVLHHFLMAGVNGCFVTADLFNLFVFFEVMLLSSFVQMSLGARGERLKNVFPYVLVNVAGSMLFLLGVGFIYAGAGSVNLALLSQAVSDQQVSPLFWGGLGLVGAVFALKTGLAPLYFWLPDSYPAAPIPVAALFAGLLTKVGVYTLYRVLPLLAGGQVAAVQNILLPVCILTMCAGVVGALGRKGFREILSFHIISQVGYMVLALAFWTRAGVAAGVFYIAHHMIVKTGLFFSAGAAELISKDKAATGLAVTHPHLSAGFFLPAMALAGLPPLSGFWAKLFVLKAGFEAQAWVSVGAAVIVSFFTLASMLKIWNFTYWGVPNSQDVVLDRRLTTPIYVLALLSLIIGLTAAPLYSWLEPIADQILDPRIYIRAVVEGSR